MASFSPPDPSRQDWGIFEPLYTGDVPRDIAGETEEERSKEAFKNVMQAAAYLFEENPVALFDLVRLLGRAEQTRRMALPLSFPGNVPGDYGLRLEQLWFGLREPLTETGENLDELAPQDENEAESWSLTASDLIMPEPWSKERLLRILPNIGSDRAEGTFEQDYSNHLVELWLPLRVAWVHGGNHSLTAGILQGEMELTPTIVRDISRLYDHVGCDGEVFFRLSDGDTLCTVSDYEWAAIFEIGRYLSEARRRKRS